MHICADTYILFIKSVLSGFFFLFTNSQIVQQKQNTRILFLMLILIWNAKKLGQPTHLSFYKTICWKCCVNCDFFFLSCNVCLEYAVCWGPSLSRPEYLSSSQSQLLCHQWEEETQSASALHLHSCDRYISISAEPTQLFHYTGKVLPQMLAKLKVTQRSTVLTLGSARKVTADIVKYSSHLCQYKPHAGK